MDRWCVVSTVGTSLISNLAREQSRDLNELLRNIANEPEQALDADTKRSVSLLADRVLDTVDTADTSRLRRMSAELNGLVSLYGERLFQPERRALDMHYLIATDTYLGMMSADLLALILEQLGFNTVIKPQFAGLTTKSYRSFSDGISRLVEWCHRELPPHRSPNSRIIFNLVGSFKSLQAYMNTLGMFYADEIVYIFEAEDAELIRIPRLPVIPGEVEALRANLSELGLLAHGVRLNRHKVKNIPEAFLVPDGSDDFRLSAWGTVVWDNQAKGLLASANLLQLPHIEYAPSFVGDYKALASPQRAQVQAALLKAAAALVTGGITALTEHTGLLYSSLESRKDSKPPIDYFRVNDDIRITCVREGSILRLRRVGRHDQALSKP